MIDKAEIKYVENYNVRECFVNGESVGYIEGDLTEEQQLQIYSLIEMTANRGRQKMLEEIRQDCEQEIKKHSKIMK